MSSRSISLYNIKVFDRDNQELNCKVQGHDAQMQPQFSNAISFDMGRIAKALRADPRYNPQTHYKFSLYAGKISFKPIDSGEPIELTVRELRPHQAEYAPRETLMKVHRVLAAHRCHPIRLQPNPLEILKEEATKTIDAASKELLYGETVLENAKKGGFEELDPYIDRLLDVEEAIRGLLPRMQRTQDLEIIGLRKNLEKLLTILLSQVAEAQGLVTTREQQPPTPPQPQPVHPNQSVEPELVKAAKGLITAAGLQVEKYSHIAEIMAGNVDTLIVKKRSEMFPPEMANAMAVLKAVLKHEQSFQFPEMVRNLAIYIGNWHGGFTLNDELYKALRGWMLIEAARYKDSKGLPQGQEKQKEELLLLTLAHAKEPTLYGDIAEALHRIRTSGKDPVRFAQELATQSDWHTPGRQPTYVPEWNFLREMEAIEQRIGQDKETDTNRELVKLVDLTIREGIQKLTGMSTSERTSWELLNCVLTSYGFILYGHRVGQYGKLPAIDGFPHAIDQALQLNGQAKYDIAKLLYHYFVLLSPPANRQNLMAELGKLQPSGDKKVDASAIFKLLSRIGVSINLPEPTVPPAHAHNSAAPSRAAASVASAVARSSLLIPPEAEQGEFLPASHSLSGNMKTVDMSNPTEVYNALVHEVNSPELNAIIGKFPMLRAIMEGYVEPLTIQPTQEELAAAIQALGILSEHPSSHQYPDCARYLGTYVANWDPELISRPLYTSFRQWILLQGATVEDMPKGDALQKLELFLLTLVRVRPELYGDIADPLNQVERLRYIVKRGLGGASRKWARELVHTNSTDPQDIRDRKRILAILAEREHEAPVLTYRGNTSISLTEQMGWPTNPNLDPVRTTHNGKHHNYLYRELRDPELIEAWVQTKLQRDALLEDVIDEFLDARRLALELAATSNPDTPNFQAHYKPEWEQIHQAVLKIEHNQKSMQPARFRAWLRQNIHAGLEALTGLQTTENATHLLLDYVNEHREFPIALKQAMQLTQFAKRDMLKLLLCYAQLGEHDSEDADSPKPQWKILITPPSPPRSPAPRSTTPPPQPQQVTSTPAPNGVEFLVRLSTTERRQWAAQLLGKTPTAYSNEEKRLAAVLRAKLSACHAPELIYPVYGTENRYRNQPCSLEAQLVGPFKSSRDPKDAVKHKARIVRQWAADQKELKKFFKYVLKDQQPLVQQWKQTYQKRERMIDIAIDNALKAIAAADRLMNRTSMVQSPAPAPRTIEENRPLSQSEQREVDAAVAEFEHQASR